LYNNITKCIRCGLQIIEEESNLHQCRKLIDYKVEGTILWGFDGERWIPRKLLSLSSKNSPPKSKHPFSTPDDETEPKVID
jgi:hypothetical protein